MTTQHTPLPWIKSLHLTHAARIQTLSGHGVAIVLDQGDDDANEALTSLILRAVNNHDALVKALEDLLAVIDDDAGMEDFPDSDSVGSMQNARGQIIDLPMTFGHLRRARAALAKAKGHA